MAFSFLVFFTVSGVGSSAQGKIPDAVQTALTQSLGVPGARLIPLRFLTPRNCEIQNASVVQPILGSGRIPVKYSGKECSGFAWAEVQVWADMAVSTRPIAKGQLLAGSIQRTGREVRRGQPPFWPAENAVASRAIPKGALVTERDVHGDGRGSTGSDIKVVVTHGSLAVTTQGRRIPCGGGRMCAVLPSGKRVEGLLDEADRLIVELP
jgi:hypothetical protein